MYYKQFDRRVKLNNKNFQKILDFYLFSCPTPGTSRRSRTFEQLGWKGAKQFAQLKMRLISAASNSLRDNYYPCKKDELEEKFAVVSNIHPVDEYCVFLKNDEKTVIQSLFSAIRNAFAHGSFNVKTYKKKRVYFFANHYHYLKAEIVLQEKTLLRWIDILKEGYDPSLKEKTARQP